LADVGDLGATSQEKLLRVLREGEFRRVGGEQTIKVSLRLISASNRDLSGMVAQEKFLEDLYYRLSGVTIRVPALRERRQDIRALAEYFLEDFCASSGVKAKTLEPAVLSAFDAWNWPGNVRELRNVIERMVILSPGEQVTSESLPNAIRRERGRSKLTVFVYRVESPHSCCRTSRTSG
jgi:two-component system, NtrC family, nitrogen regulation response regulator NtrX